VLAIIAQVAGPFSSGAVAVLSLIFPPMNYTFFIIYIAHFEKVSQATNLVRGPPHCRWDLPGILFWIFLVIQMVVYPIFGAMIERWLYGTASKDRKMISPSPTSQAAVALSAFSKHYQPSWFHRNILKRLGIKPKETVIAVNNVSMT